MEEWQIDFEWLRVRHFVKDALGQSGLPDMKAILFLIGIQELGQLHRIFSKEEKQDLMHVAVCTLLEQEGIYEFVGRDDDGWPHWNQVENFSLKGEAQETLLKNKIIDHFGPMLEESIINVN